MSGYDPVYDDGYGYGYGYPPPPPFYAPPAIGGGIGIGPLRIGGGISLAPAPGASAGTRGIASKEHGGRSRRPEMTYSSEYYYSYSDTGSGSGSEEPNRGSLLLIKSSASKTRAMKAAPEKNMDELRTEKRLENENLAKWVHFQTKTLGRRPLVKKDGSQLDVLSPYIVSRLDVRTLTPLEMESLTAEQLRWFDPVTQIPYLDVTMLSPIQLSKLTKKQWQALDPVTQIPMLTD